MIQSFCQKNCHGTACRDRKTAICIVQNSSDALRCLNDKWKSDRRVVFESVSFLQNAGSSLLHADNSLFTDRELVLKAISNDIDDTEMVDYGTVFHND